MSSNIVLIGGGNQVQYTADILNRCGWCIVGIIDSIKEIGSDCYGYKIIGRQENIKEIIKKYNIEGGLITIGDNWNRYKVSEEIKSLVPNFNFINAIHPSAVVSFKNTEFGEGMIVMAGVIINPGARLGDFTFFATGAQIEHDCIIEDFASVSAGSVMGGHVKIGKYSAITLGCTLVDRITIGENTVVGAGSVVTKSFGDNLLIYGVPAKIKRFRKQGEKFLK